MRLRSFGYLLLAVWLPATTNGCGGTCHTISEQEKNAFLLVKPEESYVLNTGDQLQIEVNTQQSRTVTIRPDGKISLPLVNDVQSAGETVPQFQAHLIERLRTYIKDPVVSVTVVNFSQKRIYISGQVRTPAAYNYSGDLYLLQAITLAGGLTPFAEGCAMIIRKKGNGFLRYDVPLEPLTTGQNLRENIQLQPGDVLEIH